MYWHKYAINLGQSSCKVVRLNIIREKISISIETKLLM